MKKEVEFFLREKKGKFWIIRGWIFEVYDYPSFIIDTHTRGYEYVNDRV